MWCNFSLNKSNERKKNIEAYFCAIERLVKPCETKSSLPFRGHTFAKTSMHYDKIATENKEKKIKTMSIIIWGIIGEIFFPNSDPFRYLY